MNKNKPFQINYALLSAVLTIPVVLLIFFCTKRLPGQDWIFMHSDFRIIYAAFAKLFWRSLLSGEGIAYTFNVSLGMPAIPLYAIDSLSPFNILYVLIDHAELASVFLVVLKLALAAYTFQRFSAKVLKNDSFSSVIFSVAYALNGYCLIFYFNIIFLDGVYMLPVIAMLISEAVKERRFVKLTLAYAYLFTVEFYGGYIVGFFSLLFFILLMITEYKKEWRKYVSASVKFGISVLTAALIGAAFLYPTAVYLLSAYGNGVGSEWVLDCNIPNIYKNLFMGQYQTMLSPYPYIYCGVMTLYLVPCFFTDKRIKKEHKLIALVLLIYLLLCSLWLPGYQFMHCFDVPDGFGFRFAYLYPFILLAIGSAEWKYMDSKKPWKLALLCILQTAAYLVLGFRDENITMWDKVSNIAFLVIFCIAFIIIKKYGVRRSYQIVLVAIACGEILLNGILTIGKTETTWTEVRGIYQAFTSVNDQAVEEIKAYDQGFYRVINENLYDPNDYALNDYYGLGYFSSMEDYRQKETLGLLGYADSPRMGSDRGGSPLTEMIFSQKYEIMANSADYILGNTDELWTINERALSLGFMAADDLLYITLDSDNAFENQNALAGGLTGEDIRVFVPYEGEISGAAENMSVIYDGKGYGLIPEEGKTEGSLIFRMEGDSLYPVYAYFSQDESNWLDDAFYFESGAADQIRIWVPSVISLPQMIELDKDREGRYYIGIYFDEDHMNYNYYKSSYFYCYDDTAVDRVYESLKDHQMNILEMKGSDITAEIDVPADKHVLFTSIPYDEGWHILVDGKEADTLAVVNDTFLAVELTEGHHELEFYYSSDSNRLGVILSIIGITIYIGMILAEKKQRT